MCFIVTLAPEPIYCLFDVTQYSIVETQGFNEHAKQRANLNQSDGDTYPFSRNWWLKMSKPEKEEQS